MFTARTQSPLHRDSSTVHEILQLGEAHCPFNTKPGGRLCSAEPKAPALQWPTDLRPNGQEPEVLAGASAKPLLAESLPATAFWRCWCGERWLPRVSVPTAVSSDPAIPSPAPSGLPGELGRFPHPWYLEVGPLVTGMAVIASSAAGQRRSQKPARACAHSWVGAWN